MTWDSTILKTVTQNSQLLEGPESVRDVLLWLYRVSNINNKKLSQLTEIPVPTLTAIRGELIKEGILNNRTTFSMDGLSFVENELGFCLRPFSLTDIPVKTLTVENFPESILTKSQLKQLEVIIKNRPDPDFKVDQSRTTFLTQLHRLALLIKNGDIEGRNILFLGDDDATSLMVSATRLARKISVVDIDDRILKYLETNVQQLGGLKISTILHDLRDPLPKVIEDTYDVVFTDPPYTFHGGKLFFQRASYALRDIGCKIYFSFGSKSPTISTNIQLYFLNSGYQLWQIYRTFNKYIGNLRLGQHSNLFVLKMSRESTIMPFRYEKKIYTKEIGLNKQENLFEIGFKEFQDAGKSIGFHIIAEFYDNQNKLFLKPTSFYNHIINSCKKSNLAIIDSHLHTYPPYGLSVVITLKESHIGIHTWPEHNYISIDVFICDTPEKAEKFVTILQETLLPSKVETININRGMKQGVDN